MQETAAVAQAVSAADFKRSVHLAVDEVADDLLINTYLQAAQNVVERATRRLFSARSVQFQCRPGGWGRWYVPVAPVISLTSAQWQDDTGAWVALDPGAVWVEMAAEQPQIVWPSDWLSGLSDGAPVRFTLTAGHDALTLPPQMRQAVLLMAKTWYDAGIAVEDDPAEAPQPFGARALMRQIRFERVTEFGAA